MAGGQWWGQHSKVSGPGHGERGVIWQHLWYETNAARPTCGSHNLLCTLGTSLNADPAQSRRRVNIIVSEEIWNWAWWRPRTRPASTTMAPTRSSPATIWSHGIPPALSRSGWTSKSSLMYENKRCSTGLGDVAILENYPCSYTKQDTVVNLQGIRPSGYLGCYASVTIIRIAQSLIKWLTA